ncbi:tetratricopeptide repeat protein [Sphingomonas populi]|uniref:Tetratricopeptide repeat protein n=1 Tax=Sphingomonas populi TaxID=2484750 RepID=A0A4Q6XM14_9SPHN|nr:tetratricopeptide repeat protein [Sphingomonas populi]RZF60545.1 tetratricopeptide repeat protein [Sphingomonas populi]
MNKLVVSLFAYSVVASAAQAEDKPEVAPAPAWVKQIPISTDQTAPDQTPVRVLLSDQQVSFERGSETVYTEVAFKIQTSQGLAAGNISFPWRPGIDILTVHKLQIRRGDQIIDVLGSGQTFTVLRREQNLENATIDGVLTANIQPEGLQVGDIVDFAASITSSDPTMKGHVEEIAAAWNGFAVSRAHLRMQWPTALPVRFRETGGLPPLKPIKTGGLTSVEFSLDNVQPIQPPKGAPLRYQLGRMIDVTDFGSWAELGALMAPLYEKATVLPEHSPLRVELDRIEKLSADPKIRAEAALALVQDRVRYVALMMGAGGYVPADAELTWSRRYGDCKGKTALLLSLLHAMDIQAEPVVVNALAGDGIDARLPMVGLFNHVLVRATVGGQTYWLDGTRTGDTSLDRLSVPNFGWGLPLVASQAALVRMVASPLDQPTRETKLRIDARAGLTIPAPTTVETTIRGDDAVVTNASLNATSGNARDEALRQYWKGEYDFIDVTSASATFDPKMREEHLVMEGSAKMDWSSDWYETDGTSIGYKADFSRDPGPNRDAPFAVVFPYYNQMTETIILPVGFAYEGQINDADVNRTIAGVEYRRHADFKDHVFTIERTEKSITPEFPAKDAPAAQTALRALAGKTIYIKKPASYHETDAELAASLATTPTTADSFVARGYALLERDRYDDAIKDFDRALALDPKNANALAERGTARVYINDYGTATTDLEAAAAIDARNAVVFCARGLMAERKGEIKTAIAAFATALEIDPDNSFALYHRADAYHRDGNNDAALLDAQAALKQTPGSGEMRLLRANIFRALGRPEESLKEAAALEAAAPDDTYAQVVAANLYHALHHDADAWRAYERALAVKPSPFIYINRSYAHSKSDVGARQADIDAALKLDPTDAEAVYAKAQLQVDTGDFSGAVATYTTALGREPKNSNLLVGRGIAYARSGDKVRAEKDFAQARAATAAPVDFNNLCWIKATAGVALESALTDCNAALAKQPDESMFLDSRALVFLRLGRLDEAQVDYDRALTTRPKQTSSLFGRGVVWARKGDKAKSDADVAAALKIDPAIRETFEGYGVKP